MTTYPLRKTLTKKTEVLRLVRSHRLLILNVGFS